MFQPYVSSFPFDRRPSSLCVCFVIILCMRFFFFFIIVVVVSSFTWETVHQYFCCCCSLSLAGFCCRSLPALPIQHWAELVRLNQNEWHNEDVFVCMRASSLSFLLSFSCSNVCELCVNMHFSILHILGYRFSFFCWTTLPYEHTATHHTSDRIFAYAMRSNTHTLRGAQTNDRRKSVMCNENACRNGLKS